MPASSGSPTSASQDGRGHRGATWVPAGEWHIGGGSAGANLTATVALQLRDQSRALPKSLLLVYGVYHPELLRRSAELRHKLGLLPPKAIYSPDVVREMYLNYVGHEEMLLYPYRFRANAELDSLPQTLLINSGRRLRASVVNGTRAAVTFAATNGGSGSQDVIQVTVTSSER